MRTSSLFCLLTLNFCLGGMGTAGEPPALITPLKPEALKTNAAFLAALDTQVATNWASLNFSTLTPRQIGDAALGYLATKNFDYLELAKRGFSHELDRLGRRVAFGMYPAQAGDYGTFCALADAYAILRQVRALSWMEEERAYTAFRISAVRFKNLLPKDKLAELQAVEARLAPDFRRRGNAGEAKVEGYPLQDGDVVVFFGDSLTGGYGPTPTALDLYPKELEKFHRIAYPERKVLFINQGKGGESIEGATARAGELAIFEPTKIFLCHGMNGAVHTNFGKTFLTLIAGVKKQAPQAQLFVISLTFVDGNLPLSDKTGGYSLAAVRQKQKMLDDALGTLKPKPIVIDVLNPMIRTMDRGRAAHADFTLFEPLDGVHPYEAGATLLAWRVFQEIGGKLP